MNIKEKFDYINEISSKLYSQVENRISNVNGIYVDSRYFNDTTDIYNVPIPMYLVCSEKPSNSLELELELNSLSGTLVVFILGELEFINNFKESCTLVK